MLLYLEFFLRHLRIFKAGAKLDMIYNLLVKDFHSLENETELMEDRRDVINISHRFRSSSNFYLSYLWRTIIEIVVVVGLLVVLCAYGVPAAFRVRSFVLFEDNYVV